jgi:antitoxin HicB
MHYKLPLIFEPQPEGGFTVTSPLLPELITEGDTFDDALENVRDALAAVIEIYRDAGRALPPDLIISDQNAEVRADMVIGVP